MRKLSSIQESLKLKKETHSIIRKLSVLSVGVIIATTTLANPLVSANQYEQQMNALRQQNAGSAAARQELGQSEDALARKLSDLRATIQTVEKQIADNQAKNQQLQQDIIKSETEIVQQRKLLGVNIKKMYLDSEFTTYEKLASSKNFSELVDKEQYRVNVQNKIKTTMTRINELKKQQEQQKSMIQKLIKDQEAMKVQLAFDRAETDRLLALNQQQQAEYGQNIVTNNARITQLQRQQAEENARMLREQAAQAAAAAEARKRAAAREAASRTSAPAPEPASAPAPAGVQAVNGHNYPWANAYFPNEIVDPWGMYQRQCVSYTAWKVAASGRHMPYWGGRGNANQWDDNARAAGIPVDYNPRVGDVAVSNAGYYGHVMYVEAVHGDGTITISQYNAGWDGRYSEARIYPGNLVFIHF